VESRAEQSRAEQSRAEQTSKHPVVLVLESLHPQGAREAKLNDKLDKLPAVLAPRLDGNETFLNPMQSHLLTLVT
jgi:hypothetical protein